MEISTNYQYQWIINQKLLTNYIYIFHLVTIEDKIEKKKKRKEKEKKTTYSTLKFSSSPLPLTIPWMTKVNWLESKRFLNKIWIYLIITHWKSHGCGGRRNRWTWMLGSRFFERKSVAGAAVALLYTRCRPRV